MQDTGETPRDVARLLTTVASNIRTLRAERGLSLAQLAGRAHLGKSTLSLLESGKGNPSVETLWAIATALGVPFGALIEQPHPPARVLRAGEGLRVASADETHVSRLLLSSPNRGTLEIYVVECEPGAVRHAEPHTSGAMEHLYLLSGRLRLGTPESQVVLEPGDLASFAADAPHHYEAVRPDTRMMSILDYA
jgi:transcriptional regulator with XRE-family HTH domain